jgi:hypothetical protein
MRARNGQPIGQGDLYIHRTLYENKVLSDSASSFYIHMGCQANSPARASTEAYNQGRYGVFQNVEGILFYVKGLALASRAKVFNDWPRDLPEEFGLTPTSRFGDGLTAYFQRDSQDTNLGRFENAAGCKRAYTWSIIGDWTLRLRYSQMSEDCISFERNNVKIEQEEIDLGFIRISQWVITDGRSRMLVCPNRSEAEKSIQVIKHYCLNRHCFVGRPEASMEYWLTSCNAPKGSMAGEDCIPIDIYNL